MTTEIKEWVTLGKKYFTQREYERAESYLRRVAKQNPKYADVQNMLGVIYHSEGRFSDSIHAFEQALAVNPNYTEALLNLAVLYNDLGQYKEARKLYDHLQKRKPATKPAKGKAGKESAGAAEREIEPVLRGKLSNLHAEVGDIYYGLGLYGPAIEEFARALTLNPTYVDIQTKLGQSQREHGELETSVKTLRDACKTNARYAQARVQLGVSLYAMGKLGEARKTWNETLTIDPENANAQMYLSLCEAAATSGGR